MSLEGWERLAPWRDNVEFVCMDMSNAYEKWAREFVPKARIVFDHFHVVKAMNEKVSAVRRRASAEGFNNKIRRLIEQAYGLRDREYFRLKVFALPNQKPRRGL